MDHNLSCILILWHLTLFIELQNSSRKPSVGFMWSMVSKIKEIRNSLNLEGNPMLNKVNESLYEHKINLFNFNLLKLTKKINIVWTEFGCRVYQIGKIVLSFHLNPHLSVCYKLDFVRTLKKLKSYFFHRGHANQNCSWNMWLKIRI